MSQQQERQSRSSFTLNDIMGDSRKTLSEIKEANAQQEAGTKEAAQQQQDDDFGAILDTLTGEKTAADASQELSRDELQETLNAKVAELAGVNQSALIKEAQLIGAAVHDGFLSRASETEFHAAKVAQVMELDDPDLEKIAGDIGFNEGIKVAYAIAEREIAAGEKQAAEQREQLKEAAYQAAHLDTLTWLSGFAG